VSFNLALSGASRHLGMFCAGTILLVGAILPVQAVDSDTSWQVSKSPYQAGRPNPKERPHGDTAIIRTVIDAVGLIRGVGPRETTATVNRLRWAGDGVMNEGAHSYKVNYRYSLSLLQQAAREDIQRVTTDGANHRQVQVVNGDVAWNESSPGVATGFTPQDALKRRMRFWRTPFGIAKSLSLAATNSIQVADRGSGPVQLDYKIEGISTHVDLDSDFRPWRVVQVIGKDKIVDEFTDYKDLTEYGLMFPTHSLETVNGKPYLDMHTRDADAGTYMLFTPPPGSPTAVSAKHITDPTRTAP
jgi:hypothetical protein